MGIQSAMYSGVSGLNTNSQAMSVIGNNLANTNTLGFKGSRTIFSDVLSSNVNGSGGMSQVGRGVGLSIIDPIFNQGTFETTSSGTDVAIEGSGFFVLKEPDDNTAYYTRAGSFRFDENGYLVNPEGLRVQGKLFDLINNNNELLPYDPTDIRVANVGLVSANPTSEMTFVTNLNANTPVIDTATYPAIDPTVRQSYSYAASTEVFDSLGQSHLLTVYWRMTDQINNTWEAAYGVDNGTTVTSLPDMHFTNIGQSPTYPDPFTATTGTISWGNGAADSVITIKLDCTQYASSSSVIGTAQNGYTAGELTNVAINNDGVVVASYSNGRQINVAQLILAKFQNPGGLQQAGANRFLATNDVGIIRVGLPGPELGRLFTNALEQSNVDMGQEFVNMIATQRGFQANSKIITTVDDMLNELINLKR